MEIQNQQVTGVENTDNRLRNRRWFIAGASTLAAFIAAANLSSGGAQAADCDPQHDEACTPTEPTVPVTKPPTTTESTTTTPSTTTTSEATTTTSEPATTTTSTTTPNTTTTTYTTTPTDLPPITIIVDTPADVRPPQESTPAETN